MQYNCSANYVYEGVNYILTAKYNWLRVKKVEILTTNMNIQNLFKIIEAFDAILLSLQLILRN